MSVRDVTLRWSCCAQVWRKAIGAERVTLNFARNGLFPLSAAAITAERIFTAAQAMRALPSEPDEADAAGGEDGEDGDADALSGLSLLSALSSHEYASLEYGGVGTENGAGAGAAGVGESPRKRRLVKLEAEEIGGGGGGGGGGKAMLVRSLLQQQLEATLPIPHKRRRRAAADGGGEGEGEGAGAGVVRQLAEEMAEASANPAHISHAVDSILEGGGEGGGGDGGDDRTVVVEEEVLVEEVVMEEEIVEEEEEEEEAVIEPERVVVVHKTEVVECDVDEVVAAAPTYVAKIEPVAPASHAGKWMDAFSRFIQSQPVKRDDIGQPDPADDDDDVGTVEEIVYFGDGADGDDGAQVVVEECVVEYVAAADGSAVWDGVEETV